MARAAPLPCAACTTAPWDTKVDKVNGGRGLRRLRGDGAWSIEDESTIAQSELGHERKKF